MKISSLAFLGLALTAGCTKPAPGYEPPDAPPSEVDGATEDAAADATSDDRSDADAGCTEHGDCASGICDVATNACVDPSAIVYVDGASGADDVGCGNTASPCKSMSFGVLQVVGDRDYLHVAPGTYVDNDVIIDDGRRVHIVAYGAELFPIESRNDITVIGASNAIIEGLATNGVGIQCYEDATLKFQHGTISNVKGGTGINITSCPALFEDSVISDIGSEAISGSGIVIRRTALSGNVLAFSGFGDVTIEQSLISNNTYAIQYYQLASNSPTTGFVFTNNVVSENGTGVSVRVDQIGAVVAHNTIVGNTIATNYAALDCSSSGIATVSMIGNIVYNNTGGANVSIGSGCTITYSNVEGGAPGTGNIDVDPEFVAGDYHLQSSSPCIDRVDSDVTIDIDGDSRPQGSASDMGADEAE